MKIINVAVLLGAEFAADTIKRRQLVKYDDAAKPTSSGSRGCLLRWGKLCPSSVFYAVVIKIPHEAETRTIQAIRYQMCYQWLHLMTRNVPLCSDGSGMAWFLPIYCRVIEILRNFEFGNWHSIRGGLMLPDSISEEKLEIGWKMEDIQAGPFWCRLFSGHK